MCERERKKEIERHIKRAPRHLENSPMKRQLDGQKTLYRFLSITSLHLASSHYLSAIFYKSLISLLFHLNRPPSFIQACPQTERWERQKERMWAPGKDTTSVTRLTPLFPLFQFTPPPPQSTTSWPRYWIDSENNKKGLTWIDFHQQSEKEKPTEDRERTESGPPITFLRILSESLTFPPCLSCLSVSQCWDCVSHTVLVTASFYVSFVCQPSPSVSWVSHWICLHAENDLLSSCLDEPFQCGSSLDFHWLRWPQVNHMFSTTVVSKSKLQLV